MNCNETLSTAIRYTGEYVHWSSRKIRCVANVNSHENLSNGRRDIKENVFWHPCKVPLIVSLSQPCV